MQETIMLPISFIVGASFISGTITGSVLSIYKKDSNHNFQRAINLSELTILEMPFSNKRGATILNTSVLGTLITF